MMNANTLARSRFHELKPLFERLGVQYRPTLGAALELVRALAHKHEPGFKRGRGRTHGSDPSAQMRNLAVYLYVDWYMHFDNRDHPRSNPLSLRSACRLLATKEGLPTARAIEGRYGQGLKAYLTLFPNPPEGREPPPDRSSSPEEIFARFAAQIL